MTTVPADAGPMFVVEGTNDELGLAPQSVALYSKWLAAKKPGAPIERFGEWLTLQGFMRK